MDIRIQCLCIDSTDPANAAQFWEAALGWRRTFDEEDQIVLEPPEGSPEDGLVPDLLFLRVSEGKQTVSRRLCRFHDVALGAELVADRASRARARTCRHPGGRSLPRNAGAAPSRLLFSCPTGPMPALCL
jgi:Glyoxalase-like domain